MEMLPVLVQHLEKIPYFQAVARAGSFQSAARTTRISQPSLTKSIRILEEALNTVLLNRSHAGVSLTPSGSKLLAFCDKMLVDLKEVEFGIAGKGVKRNISIATHEVLMPIFWCPLLKKIEKSYPNIDVSLETITSSTKMIEGIIASKYDIIVAAEPMNSPLVKRKLLLSDTYNFFATKSYLESSRIGPGKKIRLSDTSDLVIFYAGNVIGGKGRTLSEALMACGMTWESRYKLHSLESVFHLVSEGLGIGILPNWFVGSVIKNKELIKVDVESAKKLGEHGVYVCSKQGRADEVVRPITEAIQTCFKVPS